MGGRRPAARSNAFHILIYGTVRWSTNSILRSTLGPGTIKLLQVRDQYDSIHLRPRTRCTNAWYIGGGRIGDEGPLFTFGDDGRDGKISRDLSRAWSVERVVLPRVRVCCVYFVLGCQALVDKQNMLLPSHITSCNGNTPGKTTAEYTWHHSHLTCPPESTQLVYDIVKTCYLVVEAYPACPSCGQCRGREVTSQYSNVKFVLSFLLEHRRRHHTNIMLVLHHIHDAIPDIPLPRYDIASLPLEVSVIVKRLSLLYPGASVVISLRTDTA